MTQTDTDTPSACVKCRIKTVTVDSCYHSVVGITNVVTTIGSH